ncbi:glucosamine-6-phosphate deaminase [Nakamurella endophytica]|uniref:Glucosamine-6-phosphate deaminase n=2 Tax=Nakamurella endophytica TaxID=1748367 RepID=A0A917WLK0_9ACTN|nr:glucosamine-6-phosphate deaminase [Nakamurella endophytica]
MQERTYGELAVSIADTHTELGEAAAAQFAAAVRAELAEKDEIGVILALGAAQDAFFGALKRRTDIEWGRITVLHVDTYMGIGWDSPASGAQRMRKHLLDEVGPKEFLPMDGAAEPVEDELARYTEIYNRFQPEVCIVGIGESGHLAFNDPPADFDTRDITRVVLLDQTTRGQISKNGIFPSIDEVPTYGISLTMHALLKPKTVIALVHEVDKAPVVKKILEGPVTFMVPASILQQHPNAHLYLSQETASLLD